MIRRTVQNSLYIFIQKLHMFLPVKSAFKPNFNCILILPGGNLYTALSSLCVHFMRAGTNAIHAHAQMHFRCALRDSSFVSNCSCIFRPAHTIMHLTCAPNMHLIHARSRDSTFSMYISTPAESTRTQEQSKQNYQWLVLRRRPRCQMLCNFLRWKSYTYK